MLVGAAAAPTVAAGPATFDLRGSVAALPATGFPAQRCGAGAARLVPGASRCLAVTVTNRLGAEITVTDVTVELDRDQPAPPLGCRAGELDLPRFTGSVTVAPGGESTLPAMPITLRDTATNQDPCKEATLHLRFTGLATMDGGGGFTGGAGSGAGPGGGPHGSLAFTGADSLRDVIVGTGLLAVGVMVLQVSRRRSASSRTEGVGR